MEQEAPKPKLSLTALSITDFAQLLTKTGNIPISVSMVQEGLASGAPVNSDGTINLIYFVAWLAQEKSHDK